MEIIEEKKGFLANMKCAGENAGGFFNVYYSYFVGEEEENVKSIVLENGN